MSNKENELVHENPEYVTYFSCCMSTLGKSGSIIIKGPSDNSTAILIPVGDFKKYKEEYN